MSVPKIFIINLPKATDRKKHMTEMLNKQKIKFEFIEAVNGSNLTEEKIKECYNSKLTHYHHGRDLSKGEIGCALSHIKFYELVVKNNLPGAIVLEDDCKINKDFSEVSVELNKSINKTQNKVVLFQHHRYYSPLMSKNITGKYNLCDIKSLWSNASLTHGYYITLEAAKSLLRYYNQIPHTIDHWDRLIRTKTINLYCVVPYCVSLDIIANNSKIDDRPTADKPKGKLRKPWHRGLEQQLQNILKVIGIIKKQKQNW